jgi:hypothetical protein
MNPQKKGTLSISFLKYVLIFIAAAQLFGCDKSKPAPAPTGFTVATITDTAISFTWTNNAEDALFVTIEMCTGSGCENFAEVASSPLKPTETSFTQDGLTSNTTYRFRISETSNGGRSDYLTSGDVTTLMIPNSSLTSTAAAQSITLGWVVNDTTGTGIEVQRCNGAGCTDFRDTFNSPIGPLDTTYTEDGLSEVSTYRFRLRVVQSPNGASDWLTSADITTLPLAPTNMTATAPTSSTVNLTWTNNSQAATGIQVQRCVGSGCTDYTNVAASPLAPTATTYSEAGLVGGTTYRYRIRAISSSTVSDWLESGNVTTPGAPVTPASCDSPVTTLVNAGLKEGDTGVGRGLWSDVQMIPGTECPAVAYYDGSATGGTAQIKFAYYCCLTDEYIVEGVAGDNFVVAGSSATWVKLAFLTVGANARIPIIVWTTGGTTIKAAMRSAPLGTEGTWSAKIIDTVAGAATRAASISVSPLDQVSIVYLTNSTNAGRARFIYCNAGCSSLDDFTAMPAGNNIENTNQAANILGIETAWCRVNSATYYPAVVYHGNAAANIQYAVCATGDITNCDDAADWVKTSVAAVNTPTGMTMYIDPTITTDKVQVLAKPVAATALTRYTSTGTCDNPASFTAGATITGAATTTGTIWFDLMKDASGMWHIVANGTTSSVLYMNSTGTDYQNTAWNAAGTIEALTLPGAGAGGGGAAVSTSDAVIYTSYGGAAAPFNISLGVVGDITIPSNNASAVFYTQYPDLFGNINLPLVAGGQRRNISLAATSTGEPGIAFVEYSLGTATAGWMQYVYRGGTTSDSEWLFSNLPISNAASPSMPSLAFDHADKPWISFYNAGTYRYSLATNTRTDGQGTWKVYQLPTGAKTASAAFPATDDTAVAMYYSGGTAQPVVIFMNGTAAGGTGVRSVRFNPATGQFNSPVAIDTLGASYATRLTADYDKNGNIVIAYYDLTTTTVKFNFSTDGGVSWKPASAQITAAGTAGREGLSIKINPANGRPAVSYYDRANNKVYYNYCTTALALCSIAGNWTQVEAQGATAVGVSGIAIANEQLLNTSLTFTEEGTPFISYMTGIAPTGIDVGLVVTDSGTGFTPVLPVELATDTTSTNIAPGVGVSPIHFNQHGMNVSSARNSLGQLLNAHVGKNDWLYLTTCGE